MALTLEQRIARTTEKINRNAAEIRRLESQKASAKRAERNHRLIEAAATVEAVVRQSGMAGFEIDNETASEMARLWLACRKKRINGCYMEDALEHLHMKPHKCESIIVISNPSGNQSGDWQSVFLIGMLNDFAEKTEHGIIDFDTYASAPDKYDGWLIYDKSNMKVVDGTLVDELHCDIVGYYDFFSGVEIRVCSDEMDESALWVEVDFGRASIVVENGRWYVSEYN